MNVDGGFDDRTITNGSFLVSCSYDATCKIFTEGDWKCIKVLAGLEGKIMSCDVSGEAKYICTAAYDRTWKLHSFEEFV
jgi:U4/U6 small nuclear ribonucleoprotein PRP4